jgi:hypothetical protein
MADLPAGNPSATDDEALAQELRNLQRNDLSIANAQFLEDVVEHLLRDTLDRGDWPDHTKLHARFCAFLIKDAVREARNAPNGNLVLNVIWAGLSLGMSSGLSTEGVERLYSEARSTMGSAGGRKSGVSRKANRPWASYATELAKTAFSRNPNATNEKIAGAISDHWKPEKPKCPSFRTLERFVSELRANGQLPQRTGSLPKRSG